MIRGTLAQLCLGFSLILIWDCSREPAARKVTPAAIADTPGPTISLVELVSAPDAAAPRNPQPAVPDSEALRLNRQGTADFHAGNFAQAQQNYENALVMAVRAGDRPLQARILNNIAALNENLGQLSASRDYYESALESLEGTVGSEKELVRGLLGLERLELIEGNFEEAHRLLIRVQQILDQAPDAGSNGILLSELGWLELLRNRPREALHHLMEALSEVDSLNSKDQIRFWDRLGATLSELEWTAESKLAFEEGLRLAVEAGWAEAQLLSALCELFLDFPDQNLPDHCPEALDHFRSTGNPNQDAGHYWQQARYLDRLGRWEEALEASATSIEKLDLLRSAIQGRNRRERFWADRSNFFRHRIGLLMAAHKRSPAAGFDFQALEVSERLRARSLLELWTELDFDFLSSADVELRAEYEAKLHRLSDLEDRRGDSEVDAQISSILEDLDILDQKLRESSPYYQLLPPRTQRPPAALKAHLEEGTAAVDLILDEKESYLFIVEKRQLRSFVLAARADIESAAARYLSLLSDPDAVGSRAAIHSAGAQVAQLLWGENEERLTGLPEKLFFLGDGAMQPFPLAALPRLGSSSAQPKWLIESHEIVHLPSLSLLDALAATRGGPGPTRDAILLGDPLYRLPSSPRPGIRPIDPDEASRLYPNLSPPPRLGRLPFAERETATLAARFGHGAIEVAIGPKASRERVFSPDLGEFSIVHLTSHGHLDPEHAQLSALLLAEIDEDGKDLDGRLRLQDLYVLKLRAELVVASACQTGVGGARLEGVNGLTQGFLHAGARRALVSLWQVESETTAHLMDHFYEHLLAGKAPGAALRLASLRLMKDAEDGHPTWNAPFFWAPFILIGDAKPFRLPSESGP